MNTPNKKTDYAGATYVNHSPQNSQTMKGLGTVKPIYNEFGDITRTTYAEFFNDIAFQICYYNQKFSTKLIDEVLQNRIQTSESCNYIEPIPILKDLQEKISIKPSLYRDIIECSLFVLNANPNDNYSLIGNTLRHSIELYNKIPSNNARTTTSKAFQQFSTPLPYAFIMSKYFDKIGNVLEPTAGTGQLLQYFKSENKPIRLVVNELEKERNKFLTSCLDNKYFSVLDSCYIYAHSFDAATRALPELYARQMDTIIANPPFDTINPYQYADPLVEPENTWRISRLDHLIALRALECMKDDGRAAIIVGGPNGPMPEDALWRKQWDNQVHFYTGALRPFYNYLYRHYNVEDVLNVSGKLYAHQGTTANTRLILINGRRPQPQNVFYQQDINNIKVYDTWQALHDRVMQLVGGATPTALPRQLPPEYTAAAPVVTQPAAPDRQRQLFLMAQAEAEARLRLMRMKKEK